MYEKFNMAYFRDNLDKNTKVYLRKRNPVLMTKNEYKYENFLIFVCAFLYMSSMAAKGIFIAEQKYIVDLWGLEYAEASMANTYYFALYAIVQVLLFIFINYRQNLL